MIVVSSLLIFSIWIQPGQSHHRMYNMSISKCVGNKTGLQATEGNVSGNPMLICNVK